MPEFLAALVISATQVGKETCLVELQGELDVATAPRLDVTIRRLVEQGNVDVVIDLSQVTFVDCEGVAALLQARRHLAPVNGELTLTGPIGQVTSHGVALSGLDHVVRATIANPDEATCKCASRMGKRQWTRMSAENGSAGFSDC